MMCRVGIVHYQVQNFLKRASVSRFLKRMLLNKTLNSNAVANFFPKT